MNENKLFVMDGVNKCGKGTNVNMLTDRLNREGHSTTSIREPGGTDVGELIREVLLSPVERPAATNVLLFNGARAATVEKIGELLLKQNVVADRSYISTLAFQVHGDGAEEAITRQICEFALGDNYHPEAVFILDIDYGTFATRMNPDDEQDYFEKGGDRDYFERVREGFLIEAKQIGAIVVDSTQSLDVVHEEIWSSVKELL